MNPQHEIIATILTCSVVLAGEWAVSKLEGFWPRSWARSAYLVLILIGVLASRHASLDMLALGVGLGILGGPAVTWHLERWMNRSNIRRPGEPHRHRLDD